VTRFDTVSFLTDYGTADEFVGVVKSVIRDIAPHVGADPEPQQFIEVSGPVTIKSDNFRFVKEYQGFEVIEKAGTLLAHDGDEEVLTPYDNCVLIMPSKRLGPGGSAVRLGRFIDG